MAQLSVVGLGSAIGVLLKVSVDLYAMFCLTFNASENKGCMTCLE